MTITENALKAPPECSNPSNESVEKTFRRASLGASATPVHRGELILLSVVILGIPTTSGRRTTLWTSSDIIRRSSPSDPTSRKPRTAPKHLHQIMHHAIQLPLDIVLILPRILNRFKPRAWHTFANTGSTTPSLRLSSTDPGACRFAQSSVA